LENYTKRRIRSNSRRKLLRAIFGDKAGDVKDASLKASPSLHGVVLDKKLFARAVKDKRKRTQTKMPWAL
jgi:DNA-directed RNA polymerase subunit beta